MKHLIFWRPCTLFQRRGTVSVNWGDVMECRWNTYVAPMLLHNNAQKSKHVIQIYGKNIIFFCNKIYNYIFFFYYVFNYIRLALSLILNCCLLFDPRLYWLLWSYWIFECMYKSILMKWESNGLTLHAMYKNLPAYTYRIWNTCMNWIWATMSYRGNATAATATPPPSYPCDPLRTMNLETNKKIEK